MPVAEEVLTAGCSRRDRLLEKCQYFPRNVELAGGRARMQGLWRMFHSATRACHGNDASKPLCRLRGAQGQLRASPHVPVTAPCLGKDTLPLLSPAPGCEQRLQSLVPKDPGQGEMRQEEIRGKAPAVLALTAAAPLGKWETPWKSCFFFFFHPTSARG